MKKLTVSETKAVLAAMVLLLGLVLGVMGAQQATAVDAETDFGEPLVIAAQQGTPQAVVPNLIGKNKAATQKALAKAGLTLGEVTFTTTVKGKPGTVVKQKPKPKTKVDKGSAVDVMVLKATAKISPKIVQKGEKVFMEFPETVKDVTISDAQGNKLQQFKKGKRFDVTESAVATEAGRIKVAFTPPEKLYWPPTEDLELELSKYNIDKYRLAPKRVDKPEGELELASAIDSTTIENSEPGNNSRNGAYLVNAGTYTGRVGSTDDGTDYVRIESGSGGIGTLIRVSVIGNDLMLGLYGPNNAFLAGFDESVYAFVEPNTTVYCSVMSSLPLSELTETPETYLLTVYTRELFDDNEPNDNALEAKELSLGTPSNGLLFNLGGSVEQDYFKLRLKLSDANKKLQISVTNVLSGQFEFHVIPPGETVSIASAWGTGAKGLVVDLPSIYANEPFPSGYWTIRLKTRESIPRFGTGDPHPCYESDGYEIIIIEIP